MILWVTAASAVASLLLCLVVYVTLDMMPRRPSEYLISYGLPVIAPFLIAPPVLTMLLRMVRGLHDRSTLLEEEVRRRQHAESKLAILVTTDELTQLANRRAFFARATEISEGTGQDATVAVLDLDEFKSLNDTKGHAAGDAELRRYGSILREHVDVNGLAARLGGEEFGLILPHRRAAEAAAFLEELRVKFIAGGEVTASIGVADWPAGQKIDQALASADAALYRAKQRGRNRIEIATPEDAQFGTDLAPVARR
jgi:diguanylate cyclase (GGDEF)-like protein